jgi:hypothetical protein
MDPNNFGKRIRIRIKVKSLIRVRIFRSCGGSKWAVDAYNGGLEVQNGVVDGLWTNGRKFESGSGSRSK